VVVLLVVVRKHDFTRDVLPRELAAKFDFSSQIRKGFAMLVLTYASSLRTTDLSPLESSDIQAAAIAASIMSSNSGSCVTSNFRAKSSGAPMILV
jgi:hypothetical protein